MSKKTEKILLFLSDVISVNAAYFLYYYIRVESGWITMANTTELILPMLFLYLYWLLVFSFAGLYQHWFVRSRFDEFASVIKTVSLGSFFLFFIIFIDDTINDAPIVSRFIILIYWILMMFIVGTGRVLIRGFQRKLLQKGIGLRNAVIVGTGQRSNELYDVIKKFPQLGYNIVGKISLNGQPAPLVSGSLNDAPELIKEKDISEVLIALEQDEKNQVMDVINTCSKLDVHLKIMPDTYEIISGLAKTNQIYGVPLIEVMPELLSPSAKMTKRMMDIFISFAILLITLPVLLIVPLIIKLSSKGPVLYKQIRVGKGGRLFNMLKFRSMYENSEEYGPEWAGSRDKRITPFGRFLRKTHLDEVPQLFNVLRNDMSLVGPRPERPFFVEELKKQIPYYYKRLSIKPGITGWAQIKYKYDTSLDDVKSKLQFDFYYIENMSIKLDLKILINTFIVVLFMKGH